MILTFQYVLEHELGPVALGIIFVALVNFLESRDFLNVLINTEIAMLGINFLLITAAISWGDYQGQVYAICILALTASETAIGLALLILLYRARGSVRFFSSNLIR